jgi:hypothetical protein
MLSREELLGRYFLLTENILPKDAWDQAWEIARTESFQRVLLDYLCDDNWENHLDRDQVIYDQLSDAHLQQLISLAEYLIAGGAARAAEMNRQSLEWRGKLAARE